MYDRGPRLALGLGPGAFVSGAAGASCAAAGPASASSAAIASNDRGTMPGMAGSSLRPSAIK